MSEPHIIIGPAVGPGGPTTTSAGLAHAAAEPTQATAEPAEATAEPAARTEIWGVTSTSWIAPDAGPTPAGEGSGAMAGHRVKVPKHRASASSRARAVEADDDLDEPRARSVKSRNEDQAVEETEASSEPETKPKGARAGGIPMKVVRAIMTTLLRTLGVLGSLLRVLGSLLWGVMVRYPRHSLAAVASVLILAAIEFTQWRGSKDPPVNQISATQTATHQSGKGAAGNQTGHTAANDPKAIAQGTNQAGASGTQPKQPETNTAAAPAPAPTPAASSLGENSLSSPSLTSTSAAPAESPLPPPSPNGQTDRSTGQKSDQTKTEPAIVSASGLLAASETFPPAPASSLGKDGATLLASSAEAAPPAPSPAGVKEPTTRADGKSAPDPSAPPELVPAPLPSGAMPEKSPETGNAAKPEPTPDVKQPEQISTPAALPLDSLPTPAAKASDAAPGSSSTTPHAAPGQTTTVMPLPPVDAPAPVSSPATNVTEPLPGASPVPQHDNGSSHAAHESANGPATGQPPHGIDNTKPKSEPTTDPGESPDPENGPKIDTHAKPKSLDPDPAHAPEIDTHAKPKSLDPDPAHAPEIDTHAKPKSLDPDPAHAPEIDAQAKPRPIDKPELGPSLAKASSEDGQPEPKSTHGSPAVASSLPQGSHEGEHEGSVGSLQRRPESHGSPTAPAVTEGTPSGWVPIHNSGKVPLAVGEELDSQTSDGGDSANGSDSIRDSRAHAAKSMSFEMESPKSRAILGNPAADSTKGAGGQSRLAPGARRVETVPHVVEEKENFWTISRQYYGSGRYYRALWKANADRCPQIDGLRVNDVIVIPPPEDLDPSFIDPPGERTRTPRASKGTKPTGTYAARSRRRDDVSDSSEMAESSSSPTAGESPLRRRGAAGARTDEEASTDDGIPIRRSSRRSSELELPAATSDPIFARDRRSVERRADLTDGESASGEDEIGTARRSRSASVDSGEGLDTRPVHKVRPNETLRSIARDTLGSSYRMNEILDLNRDIIDDPNNLIVGQELKLPDDARTSLRRRVSR